MEIMLGVRGTNIRGEYLHWDQMRHREPPPGLTSTEWWLGIRIRRDSEAKSVPLRATGGGSFSYNLSDPIPQRLHNIDLRAGGAVQMPQQVVNPESRNTYIVRSLMEEAITSSQLEGAATTREVAKEMIRRGLAPRDRSEQMVLNNYYTMERIIKAKDQDLTKELVLEIHRIVTDKTLDNNSAAGRFRTSGEDCVVGDDYGEVFHYPPAAEELDNRMAAMIDFANDRSAEPFVHPVLKSIMLHFWLAYDHPFVDGNGRTARALFYWSMLRHRYWLFEFISISRIFLKSPIKYGRAFLHTETDDNDLTYFIIYHLDAINEAINDLYSYIDYKTEQVRSLELQLGGMLTLNHRQRDLISHALRHPGFLYSIKSHQNSHSVVYQTARSDLLDLEAKGYLWKLTQGNAYYFSPAQDLAEKLKAPR